MRQDEVRWIRSLCAKPGSRPEFAKPIAMIIDRRRYIAGVCGEALAAIADDKTKGIENEQVQSAVAGWFRNAKGWRAVSLQSLKSWAAERPEINGLMVPCRSCKGGGMGETECLKCGGAGKCNRRCFCGARRVHICLECKGAKRVLCFNCGGAKRVAYRPPNGVTIKETCPGTIGPVVFDRVLLGRFINQIPDRKAELAFLNPKAKRDGSVEQSPVLLLRGPGWRVAICPMYDGVSPIGKAFGA